MIDHPVKQYTPEDYRDRFALLKLFISPLIFFFFFFLFFFLFFYSHAVYANHTLDQIHAIEWAKDGSRSQQPVKLTANFENPRLGSSFNPNILALKKDYAFILFYRSSCPHCQVFDPVLKAFTDHYGFQVLPFTTDGISLPAFPNSTTITQSIINEFFGENATIAVPTLLMMNKNNLHVYPVVEGEMNLMEFTDRMNQLSLEILKNESPQFKGMTHQIE